MAFYRFLIIIPQGEYSNISGGQNHNATGINDWRVGSLFEDF
jgi:hypothetical protein